MESVGLNIKPDMTKAQNMASPKTKCGLEWHTLELVDLHKRLLGEAVIKLMYPDGPRPAKTDHTFQLGCT